MKENNEKIEELEQIQREQQIEINTLKRRLEELEGLDLSKYLKSNEDEPDEVIDERIAELLELANKVTHLNSFKRDSIYDYLAKKSRVNKTDLRNVVEAFSKYLEKLL